jgi:hypothetical protein
MVCMCLWLILKTVFHKRREQLNELPLIKNREGVREGVPVWLSEGKQLGYQR